MRPRLVAAAVLGGLLLVFTACGGHQKDNPVPSPPPDQAETSPPPMEENGEFAADVAEFEDLTTEDESATDPAAVRLSEVKILPERIRAGDDIEVSVETRPAAAEGTSLVVVFWINDRNVQESGNPTLPAGRHRKGDGVFADAILMVGNEEIDRRRSDLVLVENSDPVIEAVEFPEIKGPGDYVITVNATDPDDDELTYEVEGVNLPAWLRAGTNGRILLSPGDDPPEILAFEVVVSDDDGGEARRSVTMKFTPPPPAGEENTPEGT